MAEPMTPSGPLALVIESDLPDAFRIVYSARRALFVKEVQALKMGKFDSSIKIVWIDDSVSEDAKTALAAKVNRKKVALYEGSSSFNKLRDILDRRLPPLPPAKTSESLLGEGDSSASSPLPDKSKDSEYLAIIARLRSEIENLRIDLALAITDADRANRLPANPASSSLKTQPVTPLSTSPDGLSQIKAELAKAKEIVAQLRKSESTLREENKRLSAALPAESAPKPKLASLQADLKRANAAIEAQKATIKDLQDLLAKTDANERRNTEALQARIVSLEEENAAIDAASVSMIKDLEKELRTVKEQNQSNLRKLRLELARAQDDLLKLKGFESLRPVRKKRSR
jgi:DNA repair exonuclease SbcCD ATPase subunit